MTLWDADLLKLLPAFMRDDAANIGLTNGSNPLIQDLAARASLLSTWDRIENLPENELDALAWELNTKWYSQDADIETKRRLIKESDHVYMKLGTRWAVEEVISAYYRNGIVQEWFEYGGEPFTFQVLVGAPLDEAEYQRMVRIVGEVKNARSVLVGAFWSGTWGYYRAAKTWGDLAMGTWEDAKEGDV